jgi:hypothetical protein
MPGGGLEDIWGGGRHQKCINHLGGGLPKISEKGRGGTRNNVQYNQKTSAISIFAQVNITNSTS